MASPELRQILEELRNQPALENPTVEQRRIRSEERSERFPLASDVTVVEVDANGVPAEWVGTPESDSSQVILYLHGGGYVTGSCNTHRELASRISRASGARCLVIDYRRAPEHPFPAPVEDAATAYLWLLEQHVDPANMIIAGDSAGGGLAVATIVKLRDAGHPLPAGAVCISPWADMGITGESMERNAAVDPGVQRAGIEKSARMYMGDQDVRNPLASPIYADLTGLPPLFIQVGSIETLLDDATRLAERAHDAGVSTTLEVWDDVFHVWHIWATCLPEARDAIEKIGEFVREQMD